MTASQITRKTNRNETAAFSAPDKDVLPTKKARARPRLSVNEISRMELLETKVAILLKELEESKKRNAEFKNAFACCSITSSKEITFFDTLEQVSKRALLTEKYRHHQKRANKDKIVLLPDKTLFYEGITRNNIPHGYGKSYHSDSTYVGNFFEGKRSGDGTLTFDGGESIKGDWFDNAPHGFIKHTYLHSIGGEYQGNYINGKKEGFGEEVYYRRHRYVGTWKDNTRQGPGKLTVYLDSYMDGNGQFLGIAKEYDGEFKCNQRHGSGTEKDFIANTVYTGLWSYDTKHGLGKETDTYGNSYEGCWENGIMHGKFILICPQGAVNFTCHILFEYGLRQPNAQLYYGDGRYYTGSIDDSIPPNPCGQGTMSFVNFNKLTGTFCPINKDIGIGKLETPLSDDLIYEGPVNLLTGNPQGYVTFEDSNGTISGGIFENGIINA